MSAFATAASGVAVTPLFGAIEAGGTKFVCAVGTGAGDVLDKNTFRTEKPEQTLSNIVQYFHAAEARYGKISALGVGSFGPIDLHPQSPTYGYITKTPKENWAFTDIVGTFSKALDVPVGFDTDVNAAALSEGMWGAAQKLSNYIYLTVGTGVGGAAVVNGGLVHGLIHTEMGHIFVPRGMVPDIFWGACKYHNDCLEGLASGPSMKARWGKPANELPQDHRGWQIEANYLALACITFMGMYSPERIILGGGVMQQEHLFPKIRARVLDIAAGYFQHPSIVDHIETYIVPPDLGDMAGVTGAFLLARKALGE
jgi:fructokinase